MSLDSLKPLLSTSRQGYWHFEVSHKTVVERGYECARCHSADLPFAPVTTRDTRAAERADDGLHQLPRQVMRAFGSGLSALGQSLVSCLWSLVLGREFVLGTREFGICL
jgi:hypothetical protein